MRLSVQPFWLSINLLTVLASPRLPAQTPLVGSKSASDPRNSTSMLRGKREAKSITSTCGYSTGDANQPRTANSGFDCSIDTANSVWGFCPTTVIAASFCDFPANCVDLAGCADGCGLFGSGITTIHCTETTNFCSTALLTVGPDSTYTAVGCGPEAKTDDYLLTPTKTGNPSSSTSSTSSTSSSSSTTASGSELSLSSSLSTATSTSVSSASDIIEGSSPTASGSASTGVIQAGASASKSSDTGAIVGGIVGGIAFISFAAFAIFFLRRHKKNAHVVPSISKGISKEAESHRLGDYGPIELPSDRPAAELPGQTGRSASELPGTYTDVPSAELPG